MKLAQEIRAMGFARLDPHRYRWTARDERRLRAKIEELARLNGTP